MLAMLVVFSCDVLDDTGPDSPDPDDPSAGEVFTLHFIDVGQGDAIFLRTPRKNLLVDGGVRNSGVTGYLQDLEIDTIHLVIGTHPHADHIGGLIEVFQRFVVLEVIDPGVTHTTVTFRDYLTAIEEQNITFTVGRKGMEWSLSDEASMHVLHPSHPSGNRLNDASIVARLDLGEIRVLLTGDAEQPGEQAMLSDPESLRAHILKVGHHGSNTSSTWSFLQAVQPEVSVIMCGLNNRYGHPHEEVLMRLSNIGTDIFRTDHHGHVVIEIQDGEYTVNTQKP